MIKNARIAFLFGDVDNGGASGSADYDNGIWQHTLNVQRVPLEKKMSDEQIALWCKSNSIDVLFTTMWGTFVAGTGKNDRGIKTLKEYYPSLRVVGVVDEPLLVDIASRFGGNVSHMNISKGYVDGLKDFDAIICLIESEREFYSSFNKNVEVLGLPFPDDSYPRGGYSNLLSRPRKEKADKIWVGLGVGGNAFTRWERNYLCSAEAFNRAVEIVSSQDKEKASRMEGIFLSWTEKTDLGVIDFFKTRYKNLKLQIRSDMRTYLQYLQTCDFVINACLRDTPQRINFECAYFKVPFVHTRGTGHFDNDVGQFNVEAMAQACAKSIIEGRDEELIASRFQYTIDNFGREAMRKKFHDFMVRSEICDGWVELGEKNECFL